MRPGQRRSRALAPQTKVYDAAPVKSLAPALLLATLFFAATAEAADTAPVNPPTAVTLSRANAAGMTVRTIRFERLERTRPFVVQRELRMAAGRPLDLADLDESVQRLNNLGIFRLVRARLEAAPGGVGVVLLFDEKWTLLPIFSAGRGGGVLHMTVGAVQTHLLGRYLETGLTYQYFNGTHSGAAWLVDPRLLHKRIAGRLDVGVSNRVRTLYDDDGAVQGSWSLRRLYVAGDLKVDIEPRWLAVGGGVVVGLDRYDEGTLTAAQRQLNLTQQLVLPEDRRDVMARLHLRLGRIDTTDYFQHGRALTVAADLAPSWLGSEEPFARATLAGFGYVRLGQTGNIGARVMVGAISDAVAERQFYVGGLGWRRGFAQGRYRGTRVWNANLEARVSSIHHRIIALQHVLFCDVGAVADDWQELADESGRPPVSVGTGIRLVLPLVARFLARLDVALALGEQDEWRVSFGSQQFF